LKSVLTEQADLTRDGNRINHDNFVAMQRAYLFGADTQVQTINANGTEQTQVMPKWQNDGNTPATYSFEIRCPILVEKNENIRNRK